MIIRKNEQNHGEHKVIASNPSIEEIALSNKKEMDDKPNRKVEPVAKKYFCAKLKIEIIDSNELFRKHEISMIEQWNEKKKG